MADTRFGGGWTHWSHGGRRRAVTVEVEIFPTAFFSLSPLIWGGLGAQGFRCAKAGRKKSKKDVRDIFLVSSPACGRLGHGGSNRICDEGFSSNARDQWVIPKSRLGTRNMKVLAHFSPSKSRKVRDMCIFRFFLYCWPAVKRGFSPGYGCIPPGINCIQVAMRVGGKLACADGMRTSIWGHYCEWNGDGV